jgi:hypothetical protein
MKYFIVLVIHLNFYMANWPKQWYVVLQIKVNYMML